jgi:hypothetical protein
VVLFLNFHNFQLIWFKCLHNICNHQTVVSVRESFSKIYELCFIPLLYLLRQNQSDCLFSRRSSEVFTNIERGDCCALDRSFKILYSMCMIVNHYMWTLVPACWFSDIF